MRTYDDRDGQKVKTLLDDAYDWDAHYAPQSYDAWRAYMTDHDEFDPSLWFLVERNGELVACALHWKEHNRRGWLKDLAVHESMRGAGLGKALVRHGLLAYAGARGRARRAQGRRGEPDRRAGLYAREGFVIDRISRSGGRRCDDTDVRFPASLAAPAAARAVAAARAAGSRDRERRSG